MLATPLGWFVRTILKYPYVCLFLMIAGAVCAGLYSKDNMTFKNRRLDLINPKSEWNQYWLEYIEKFGSEDDLIIVVDGDSEETILPAVNETAMEIEKLPNMFHSLFYKFDDTALFSKGLYFASDEELEDLSLFLKSQEDVFQGKWDNVAIDHILPQTVLPLTIPEGQIPPRMVANLHTALERMIFSLEKALGPKYEFVSPFPNIDISHRRQSEQLPIVTPTKTSTETNSEIPTSQVSTTFGLDSYANAFPSNLAYHVNYPDIVGFDAQMAQQEWQSQSYQMSYQTSNQMAYQDASYPPQPYQPLPEPTTDGLVLASVNPYYATSVASVEMLESTPMPVAQIPTTVVPTPFDVTQVSGDSPISTKSGELTETVGNYIENDGDAPHSDEPITDITSLLGADSHIHYTWLTPNKTAIMMVKMVEEQNSEFARGTKGIDTLREIIKSVQQNHPNVGVHLTGLPIMENDEMRSSQASMNIATWLSILGVAILYIFFFRELRHPFLAIVALFVGIGWSMAYITFFVGHLNILSISFAVILIGLGIDFGIHYTSRYLQCRNEGDDTYTALIRGTKEIGPGILTGALTTAAAFFTAGLTEFTGVAELGIIAGGGVLCCCLAALTMLPVMIYLSDRNRPHEKIRKLRSPSFLNIPPIVTFLIGMSCVVVISFGLPKLYYDYNLLNLQPEGLESVELEMRLINESKQSVWYALSMSDDESVLRERIAAFSALPSVERVEQLVTLIPGENPLVREIHNVLVRTPEEVCQRPYLTKEDARKLYQCLDTARRCLAGNEEFASYLMRIDNLQKQLLGMRLTDYFERMTQYQESLARDLLVKLNILGQMASPEPPTLDDLPKPYVDRMCAKDGTFLLKIYGKGDLWDMANLKTFVHEVRSVDPKATGNPLQTYECSLQMKKGYQEAAIYALIIVVVLLLLDLRNVVDTFLALFPVQLGLLCTFGILGFFNIPLNAANMIVLPLILGIGIDDGVHIIHDYRKFYRGGVYRITSSTSMSIILTSFTTILSFGTLMLAQHRGLQSLGLVLVIGTVCCWLTSLLILPAVLNLFFTRGKRGVQNVQEQISTSDETRGTITSTVSDFTQQARQYPLANQPLSSETFSSSMGDDYIRSDLRWATCYTLNEKGEIVNSRGRAA